MKKKLLMISILMMTIGLFSCSSTPTCETAKVVIPAPINHEVFPQGELNCLTSSIKKNVVEYRVSCTERIKLLRSKLENVNKER